MWQQNRHYADVLCLKCAPSWAIGWWEKRADKGTYTCSACSEALPRVAYSREGFSQPDAIVCMDCNRDKIVQRRTLEEKRFNCVGPCRRQNLTHHEFAALTLLNKNFKIWLCKACQFPKCERCHLPSETPVPFGPAERKELARKKEERQFVCEWCSYPPCGGCGLKRTRASKREKLQFRLWFCQTCLLPAADEKERLHPPCSGCGLLKTQLQQKDLHAHRAWRCSAYWRKAES